MRYIFLFKQYIFVHYYIYMLQAYYIERLDWKASCNSLYIYSLLHFLNSILLFLDSIILLKEEFTHIICCQAQFLLMTQIFKVCQIDHCFGHFGHLFMLLTIATKYSYSDPQTQFGFMKVNQKLMNYRFKAK